MNLIRNPDLLDRLACAHALGTLRGGARRRLEALARHQAPVHAAILAWQHRLAGLTELQAAVPPSPAVWTRIANLLEAERAARAAHRPQTAINSRANVSPAAGLGAWLQSLGFWRGATLAGALATVAAMGVGLNIQGSLKSELLAQRQATQMAQAALAASPQVAYVAVLAAEQSAATMLVTFDPRARTLTLQRVGGYQEATDKSLQLWALPPGQGAGPKSLGVLGVNRVLQLTAAEADLRQAPALAISLEPKGGVDGARGPTGPVLFKGALIQRQL
jgi:anti-sigma-K factor RskA